MNSNKVTVAEAALMLGVSKIRVHQMIEEKKLKVVEVEQNFPGGSRRWLSRKQVEKMKEGRVSA